MLKPVFINWGIYATTLGKKSKQKGPCIFPKLCATASNRLDLVYKYNILHIGSTFV